MMTSELIKHLTMTPIMNQKGKATMRSSPITPICSKRPAANDSVSGGTLNPTGLFTCKDPADDDRSNRIHMAKDYQFEDADYDIWSSDVIRFRVHSYRLQAASPYFRKLFKDEKASKRLDLEHDGCSDAKVVKVLLDIIHTSEPDGCRDVPLSFQVIDLATRWECDSVLKILKRDLAIQALINSANGPTSDHLRLAHRLKDHHLMALISQRDRNAGFNFASMIIEADHTEGYILPSAHRLYDTPASKLAGILGVASPTYEIGGMSYVEFLRLPPTVVWALSRATYLARKDCCQDTVNVDDMGRLFEGMLSLAYPDPDPVPQLVTAVSDAPPSPVYSTPEEKIVPPE